MNGSQSNVYASLDEREIAQDRRLIYEKMRKHLKPSSEGGEDEEEMFDVDMANDFNDVTSIHGGDGSVSYNPNTTENEDAIIDDDMNEVYDSMQRAMYEKSVQDEEYARMYQMHQQQRNMDMSMNRADSGLGGLAMGSGPSMDPRTDKGLSSDMSTSSRSSRSNRMNMGGSVSHMEARMPSASSGLGSSGRMDTSVGTGISTRSNKFDTGHLNSFSYRSSQRASSNLPTVVTQPTSFEIPKTQHWNQQVQGLAYICMSLAVLVSYFFFLESCKLVNYGT